LPSKIIELKVAFKIPPAINNITTTHLLVEVSDNEVAFLIFSEKPMLLEGYYIYELEKNITASEYALALNKIIDNEDILRQSFASKNIFYNLSSSTFIPITFFVDAEKENVLELMFGKDKSSYCFQENVRGNDIKNIYRVPSKIYDTINKLFPKNKFSHSSSMQINNPPQNTLECTVYHNSIKPILHKDGKLQIVQYFDYEMHTDVSYHLLNVCEQFEVSATDVSLVLSGMVDESSNLKNDIFKYFLNVSFACLPNNTSMAENLKSLPIHFYTNLSALALCV
jgi:Protein of unknown function (DUF3822)